MRREDNDIETLEALFGEARDDYRALQHGAPLNLPDTAEHRRPAARWVVAASLMAGLVVVGLLSNLPGPDRAETVPQRIAAPGSFPQAPSAPGFATTRPIPALPRPTLNFSMPERPSGLNG